MEEVVYDLGRCPLKASVMAENGLDHLLLRAGWSIGDNVLLQRRIGHFHRIEFRGVAG